jgi:hypothetical protein
MKKILIILLVCAGVTHAQKSTVPTKAKGDKLLSSEINNLVASNNNLYDFLVSGAVQKQIDSDTTLLASDLTLATLWIIDASADTVRINVPEILTTSTFQEQKFILRLNSNSLILCSPDGQSFGSTDTTLSIRDEGKTVSLTADVTNLEWLITQDSRSEAVAEVYAYIDSSISNSVTSTGAWTRLNGRFDNQYTLGFGLINDTLAYVGTSDSVRIYIDYNGSITAGVAGTEVGIRLMQNGVEISGSQRHVTCNSTNSKYSISGGVTTILRTGDTFVYEIQGNKNTTATVAEFATKLLDVKR